MNIIQPTIDKYKELIEKKYTIKKIGVELGVSQGTVKHWLKKFKLKTDPYRDIKQLTCKSCNKSLTETQRLYCSKKCNQDNSNIKFQKYLCQQDRGLERKLKFVKNLGGKCSICNYSKNLSALVFHHRNPEEKKITLDLRAMSNNSMEILTNEINKCQLLCHNCHHELHNPRLEMVGLLGFEPRT